MGEVRSAMEEKTIDENVAYLIRGILTLHTPQECLSFFEDLCTPSELQEMSRRLQAAKMLKNRISYNRISKETGLSTVTIGRVNRCLQYGDGGYITVLSRMEPRG